MRSQKEFQPGWRMTRNQWRAYWKMASEICVVKAPRDAAGRLLPMNNEQREAIRRDWHVQAGLGPVSAKSIDHLKGFDAIKAAHLAILQPGNLHAQMRMADMPRHRLITRITGMAPEAYIRHLLTERFHARELEDLDESELTQMRNTLEARMARKAAREASEAEPVPAGGVEDDNVPF